MLKHTVLATVLVASMFSMVVGVSTARVGATPNASKVTICHRTGSYSNPYVQITVAQSAADGNLGNDNGRGDHYAGHQGPVFSPTIPKGTKWGDIIPPIPGIHDGLNWTTEGQAIYAIGCKIPASTPPTETPNVSVTVTCNPSTNVFTVAFSNSGNGSANVEFNGETFTLNAGASATRSLNAGQTLTVKVDGTVYQTSGGEALDHKVLATCQGNGSVSQTLGSTPTTPPATPSAPGSQGQGSAGNIASLPNTGTAGSAIASMAAVVATTVSAVIGYVLQRRGSLDF